MQTAGRVSVIGGVLVAFLLLLSGTGIAGGSGGPVFLEFLNAPAGSGPLLVPPRLLLSFGGRPVAAVMDTGSTGIVISASAIPGFAQLSGPPGLIEYSSSGRIERGFSVDLPVTIAGLNGGQVTTRPIPVLAVTRVDCTTHARNCRVRIMPRHVAMLGVGFGREADHQPESTPDRNPFLALAGPQPIWKGYTVSRKGVTLGLDPALSRGFRMVHLVRSPRFPDWDQAPACISVAAAPPACGVGLMDTGVVVMYLSAPSASAMAGAAAAHALPEGTRLAIALPDAVHPVASYAITVGEAPGPLDPDRVILVRNRSPFVNTSARFLNGFDYLFNASLGVVGYRPDRSR
ncbi:MAG: hypothetical protein ACREFO_13195 [Acetobacteraceae bacterium]